MLLVETAVQYFFFAAYSLLFTHRSTARILFLWKFDRKFLNKWISFRFAWTLIFLQIFWPQFQLNCFFREIKWKSLFWVWKKDGKEIMRIAASVEKEFNLNMLMLNKRKAFKKQTGCFFSLFFFLPHPAFFLTCCLGKVKASSNPLAKKTTKPVDIQLKLRRNLYFSVCFFFRH